MIKFRNILYRNFLGAGDQETSIQLDKVRTTLITGTNGSGKSTLLDALCFALYGKAYRSINKPQLVNSVNGKRCEVTVEFSKGDTLYKVTRGIGPNKFEILINGAPTPLAADARQEQANFEKNVLGMDYTAFTQIVILGSARYQSFMDLEAAKRKELVENLLDIGIFSRMNDVLSSRMKLLKNETDGIVRSITLKETSIHGVKRLIEAEKNTQNASKDDLKEEMGRQTLLIDELDADIERLQTELSKMVAPGDDLAQLRDEYSKATKVATKLTMSIDKCDHTIKFYKENAQCAECAQDIDSDFATGMILSNTDVKVAAQRRLEILKDHQKAIDEREKKAEAAVWEWSKQKTAFERSISSLTGQRDAAKRQYKSLLDKLETPPADSHLEEYTEELKSLQEKLEALNASLDVAKKNAHYMMIAKALLKDTGIKAKIVAQYLPVMNSLINQYLDKMGADYSFTLDANFEEVIKSRYRDKFSYNSFSEGQKMRIDLALMFTWREVARMKNSVNTNLLILDEIGDSSLDSNGAGVLWEVLNDMDDSNVFVISHRANNIEMFDRQLTFKQIGNFSKLID